MRWLVRHLSFYPPYIGAGIRARADLDHNAYHVQLRMHWFNRNLWGTHFGGSLFSMCDPFFALVLQDKLGSEFEVWMRWADIEYLRPGVGTVSACFHVPQERVEQIREEARRHGKAEPEFAVEVTDEGGRIVARVQQRVHVRRRHHADRGLQATDSTVS